MKFLSKFYCIARGGMMMNLKGMICLKRAFFLIPLFLIYFMPQPGYPQSMDFPATGTVDINWAQEAIEGYRQAGDQPATPAAGLMDAPSTGEILENMETSGLDVENMYRLLDNMEAEGQMELSDFYLDQHVDLRKMKDKLLEKMRTEGYSEPIMHKVLIGEIDKSIEDWLREQGAEEKFLQRAIDKEPEMGKIIMKQARETGFLPDYEYEIFDPYNTRKNAHDWMQESGFREREVNQLRTEY